MCGKIVSLMVVVYVPDQDMSDEYVSSIIEGSIRTELQTDVSNISVQDVEVTNSFNLHRKGS